MMSSSCFSYKMKKHNLNYLASTDHDFTWIICWTRCKLFVVTQHWHSDIGLARMWSTILRNQETARMAKLKKQETYKFMILLLWIICRELCTRRSSTSCIAFGSNGVSTPSSPAWSIPHRNSLILLLHFKFLQLLDLLIVTIHLKKASNLNLSIPSSPSCSIALPRERRRRIAFDQRVAIQIYILNVHIQIQTAKLNLNWSWIENSRIPLKTNLPPIKQMVARLFLRHQLFQMTLSRAHGLFGKLETPAPFADTVATICTRELPGKLHQFTNIATHGNYA